jgi:hypothetical protein
VTNATLSRVDSGVSFVNPGADRTSTVESATVRNVTVRDPASPETAYVRVDDTNDVTVRSLATPNATVARFDGTNVSLTRVGATPAAPQVLTEGRVAVAARSPGAVANASITYDDTGLNESTVRLYRVDEANGTWTRLSTGASVDTGADVATLTSVGPGTYGAFAGGSTTVEACTRIETAGVYTLTGNLTASGSGACLAVNASDVTIDGTGHAIVGNDSAAGVAAVRAGLSGVTVRNLSVVDLSDGVGVDLNDTTDATVTTLSTRDVGVSLGLRATTGATVRDSTLATGDLDAGSADGVQVRNVSVADGGGVDVTDTTNATIDDLTVVGDGVDLTRSRNATVRSLRILGTARGVEAAGATGLQLSDARIESFSRGLLFTPVGGGATAAVESATVTNLTVAAPDFAATPYVAVDDTNDVVVRDLTTPNVTITRFEGANATLSPTPATPPAPQPVTAGRVDVTASGPGTTANVSVAYDPIPLNESTVTGYRVDEANGTWTELSTGVTIDRAGDAARFTGIGAGTYGAFADTRNTTIDACMRIDAPGVYELAGNLTANTSGACLAVNASDVTIDGNGAVIDGNRSATGVETVQSGAANVTVRNLTIRDLATGVDVSRTTLPSVRNVTARGGLVGVDVRAAGGPTVADVLVVTDDNASSRTTGLEATFSGGLTVRNVTVRSQTAWPGTAGAFLPAVGDARISGLTVRLTADDAAPNGSVGARNETGGVFVTQGFNVSMRDTTVDGYAVGVGMQEVAALSVDGVVVRNASTGVRVAPRTGTDPGLTETGTLRDVTVGPVTGTTAISGEAVAPAYAKFDANSALTVRDLSTPNATLARFAGQNLSLTPVAPTPAPPQNVTVGRINATGFGAPPSANATFAYDARRVDESTVAAYDLAAGSWSRLSGDGVAVDTANDTVRVQVAANTTYGTFGDEAASPVSRTVDTCTRIDTPGVYRLDGNLTANASGPCLAVTTSDVVVDGTGHAIVGNDSASGVEAVQDGLSNVTVRNLSVIGLADETGIELDVTTDATVRDVRVRNVSRPVSLIASTDATLADATLAGSGQVVLDRSTRVRVRNVTATGNGVTLRRSTDADVDGLSARGGPTAGTGLDVGASDGPTVRNVSVTDAVVGIGADGVRDLTLADARVVRPLLDGVLLAPDLVASATVESGTVRNLTIVAPSPGVRHLRVDGSNDVTVRNLTTPNATVTRVAGTNVSLVDLGATPPAPQAVTAGRVNVTAAGPDATAAISVAYDPSAVNESTVAAYRVDPTNGTWTRFGPNATTTTTATVDRGNDTVALANVTPGTYGGFAAAGNDTNGSLPLGERLFPNGVPGSSTGLPPIDDDGDGLLEDVTGDGRFSFEDVIEFVFSIQRNPAAYDSLSAAQTDALDHSDDGRVSFTDVIDLVFELQNR